MHDIRLKSVLSGLKQNDKNQADWCYGINNGTVHTALTLNWQGNELTFCREMVSSKVAMW